MTRESPNKRTQEAVYIVLFVVFTCVYIGLSVHGKSQVAEQQPSTAVQEFKDAEKEWKRKLQDKEILKRYFEEYPVQGLVFNLLSLCLFGGILIGLGLNFLLLRSQWRSGLSIRGPDDSTSWSFHMIFKVLSIWMLLSITLSLSAGFLHQLSPDFFNLHMLTLTHTLIMDVFIVYLIVWVIQKSGGQWRDIGFHVSWKELFREARVGLLGYAAVLPPFFLVMILALLVAQLIGYEPPAHPLVEILLEDERGPSNIIYSIILAAVLGPIMEEIFFRGFCFSIFKHKWGFAVAAVTTSAFFAFIHQNQFAFWPIFVLGLALAYLRETRKSLIAPMTLHIVHNSFFLAYFFLAKAVVLNVEAISS